MFENKVYKRLERIFKYAKTFYTHSHHNTGSGDEYTIEFHSDLGDVQIIIFHADPFAQQVGVFNYTLEYANYAGSTVFKVCTYKDKFDVTPLLGDNLGGHDVDLAIYELEQFLKEQYGDVDKYIQQKEKERQEVLKRHKKELKILEHGI